MNHSRSATYATPKTHAELVSVIRPADLLTSPPRRPSDGCYVAELSTLGLGGPSYVMSRDDDRVPEWIVLQYADDRAERVWKRTGHQGADRPVFALTGDSSSMGYVSVPLRSEYI